MKTAHGLLLCLLALSGCKYVDVETPLVPFKSDTTGGHKYTSEAIAFLNTPEATREEVIATFGPAIVESSAAKVLLYTWQVTSSVVPFQIVSKDRDPATGVETTTPLNPKAPGTVQQWGLFIAYNDRGKIVAHEVTRTGASGLEEACIKWQRTVIK
jgi:hypothetical protein